MKENSSPNNRGPRNRGGRRSGNRGPRHDHQHNDPSRPARERSNYGGRDGIRDQRPAKPLSLWQKIVGFFSGKPKPPAPSNAPRSQHPTEVLHQQRTQNQRSNEGRSSEDSRSTGRPSDSYRRRETRPTEDSSESVPTDREARPPREPREPRAIEIVEVTTPKLYVGNLSFDAAESDLFDLFNGVGKVRNAEVVSNNYTQKSKGFAFVTMETIDEAKRAVLELHDKEFMGRKMLVSGAKSSERDNA